LRGCPRSSSILYHITVFAVSQIFEITYKGAVMKKIACITLSLFYLSGLISAQQRPFPQNIKYPYGFIPTTLNSDWVKSEYDRWKSALFSSCSNGEKYIKTDNGGKVEAVGFGMLVSAYMGEKADFDALYNYYKTNCNSGAGGLMGWIGQCGGNGNCSASDGDVDVAFSLIVASWQWPDGGYLEKAKAVITNLKKVVTKCGDLLALQMGISGGNVYNGCNQVDISYYNPAAFREYAKVVGNKEDSTFWVKAADDTYTILNAGANATTGLVADRQSTSGSPSGNYAYDACRTPWRICLDYLWNGNEKAQAWCKKVSDWAYKVGPKNIKDGYSLSGSASGGNHNMAFTGGFAVAAMAHSQEAVDAFGTELKSIKDQHWFSLALTPGYLLTISGNQWRNDLKDTVKVAVTRNNRGASYAPLLCKVIGNRTLSVADLQSGQAIVITDISGKRLFSAKAQGDGMIVDLSKMKTGCAILTITDKSKNILKRGRISIM
jgi:endo-1,4-beta-D-glucanase Y